MDWFYPLYWLSCGLALGWASLTILAVLLHPRWLSRVVRLRAEIQTLRVHLAAAEWEAVQHQQRADDLERWHERLRTCAWAQEPRDAQGAR